MKFGGLVGGWFVYLEILELFFVLLFGFHTTSLSAKRVLAGIFLRV